MILIRVKYKRQATRFPSESKTSNLRPWPSNRPTISRVALVNNVSIGIACSEVLWIPLRGHLICPHRTPNKNTWTAWQSTWTGSTLASPSRSFTRQHATHPAARRQRCISAQLLLPHHHPQSLWRRRMITGWLHRSNCVIRTNRLVAWSSLKPKMMMEKPAVSPSQIVATIRSSWIKTQCPSFTKRVKIRFQSRKATFASHSISCRQVPRHLRCRCLAEMLLSTKTYPSAWSTEMNWWAPAHEVPWKSTKWPKANEKANR